MRYFFVWNLFNIIPIAILLQLKMSCVTRSTHNVRQCNTHEHIGHHRSELYWTNKQDDINHFVRRHMRQKKGKYNNKQKKKKTVPNVRAPISRVNVHHVYILFSCRIWTACCRFSIFQPCKIKYCQMLLFYLHSAFFYLHIKRVWMKRTEGHSFLPSDVIILASSYCLHTFMSFIHMAVE